MSLPELTVEGSRSIRQPRLPLGPVNVLTGPNGCGKSNLCNSMFLLSKAAAGGLGRAIAEEREMPCVLSANTGKVRLTRKRPPRRVALSFGSITQPRSRRIPKIRNDPGETVLLQKRTKPSGSGGR